MQSPRITRADRGSIRSLWATRALLVAAAVAVTVLGASRGVAADEPGESTVASELIRQAIALIVNTPDDMEAIDDKVVDALEVENQEGVDIALVRQAANALERRDLHTARVFLERSIGARPHLGATDVAPIGQISNDRPARGAEPGDAPILDPLDTSDIDGGDIAAIATGLILALAGALLGLHWRPRVTRA